MNTWLVGFAVEISGVEMMIHHMVSTETPELAESGAMMMGRSWWEDGKAVHEGYSWIWPYGSVWFHNITLLDDVENSVLRNLKFLDVWIVSGTPESPIIRDEYGENWLDFTR